MAAPAPVPAPAAPGQPHGTFKCVLVGDGATGKTTFVSRLMTGDFEKKYIPTVGANVKSIDFYTTHGHIRFNVWDTAGQEKYGLLREGYYIGASAAIIFFDVTNKESYNNVDQWYRDLKRVCDNIPMVVVGNKVDVVERQVRFKQIRFPQRHGIQYYDISARSNYNVEKPWLHLMRRLVQAPDLAITQAPAMPPPDIALTDAQRREFEDQVLVHAAKALPENDDEDDDLNP